MTSSPPPAPLATGQSNDRLSVIQSRIAKVYLVVLENLSYSDVAGSPSMPYWNSLAAQNGVATNFFANDHGSIGEYFMMTTGQIITSDNSFRGTVDVDNLVREFKAAGKTWRAYAQSIPSAGYLGPDVGPYVRPHNPFAYFSDVKSDPSEAQNIRPLTDLDNDIAAGKTANFNFLLPDNQHNAHDCPNNEAACQLSEKLTAADEWLRGTLSPLLASAEFQQRGLLIITFDEGDESDVEHGGGHIPVLLVGGTVIAGFRSATLFQHESVCRLIFELAGIATLPGAAASAPTMYEFFR
jgi:acid phosphatase